MTQLALECCAMCLVVFFGHLLGTLASLMDNLIAGGWSADQYVIVGCVVLMRDCVCVCSCCGRLMSLVYHFWTLSTLMTVKG